MNQNHKYSVVPVGQENSSKNQLPTDEKFYRRKRYYVTAFGFLAIVLNYLLRINVSICIVDMTSNRTIIIDNITHTEPAEYNWTPPEKGLILSSFSWGLLFTPFGHLFVDRFGAAASLGYVILFTGILTILSPLLISAGMYTFMIARGFEGLFEGLIAGCLYAVGATWIPANERSRLMNFICLGIPAGTMISYFITGLISYLLGWKWVFYITGGMAFVWYAIWTLTVADTPDLDKYMTEKEKIFIREQNKQFGQPTANAAIPWKSILKSSAALAYLNERFVEAWSISFLTYCLPLYIKDVHSLNIRDIGFFSAMPHLFGIFSTIAGSCLQDWIRTKTSMSKTKFHKTFILFGQLAAVIVLVLVGTWINFYGNMIAFCIFKIAFSIGEISYYVLPMDLSPQHSNFIGSLAMSAIAVVNLLNPLTMGFMVQNHASDEWSRYFFFLACFNLWGAIIFAKFGSGELQPWGQES